MMYCIGCGGKCEKSADLYIRGGDLKPDCWVWRTELWFWAFDDVQGLNVETGGQDGR